MPATEETYRRQPTLHLVFAISSIAMLLVDRLDDHGRPPPPLEAGPARVPAGRGRPSSRPPRRRSSRSSRTAVRRRRSTRSTPRSRRPRPAPTQQRRARSAQLDSELDQLGRQGRAARHREAVQEGRARQQAQPLRRHDRPRRGRARPGLPRHDDRRHARRSCSKLTEEFEEAEAELEGAEGAAGGPARPRRRAREGDASG